MDTVKIPVDETELAEHLSGLHTLLTAKKWERAALVYAFTDIGGPRNSSMPEPPKMNIQRFSELGFAGLTSRKAVMRYRAAWITAISNGWAVPVDPGDIVELPDQEFPAWDGTLNENDIFDGKHEGARRAAQIRRAHARRTRLMTELDAARHRLLSCQGLFKSVPMTPELIEEVVVVINDIQREIKTLRDLADGTAAEILTPTQIAEARERWSSW